MSTKSKWSTGQRGTKKHQKRVGNDHLRCDWYYDFSWDGPNKIRRREQQAPAPDTDVFYEEDLLEWFEKIPTYRMHKFHWVVFDEWDGLVAIFETSKDAWAFASETDYVEEHPLYRRVG